jgi:hypothetical protein
MEEVEESPEQNPSDHSPSLKRAAALVSESVGRGRLGHEAIDDHAAEQLQTLRAILRLEQEPKRADIVRRGEMLRDWIGAQGLPSCPSLRGLANRAFRFGRYRLAYEIGELEDMTDATV